MYTPDEATLKRIENNFTYHAPFGSQVERYQTVRDGFKELVLMLVHNCPPSRELSLALTHIEDACYSANAAIARNEKEK